MENSSWDQNQSSDNQNQSSDNRSLTCTELHLASHGFRHASMFYMVVMFVMGVFITVVNMVVIYLVASTRSLRTCSNFFILSLAATDLINGQFLFLFALQGVSRKAAEWTDCHMQYCLMVVCLHFTFILTSVLLVSVIALDRYLCLFHPFFYEEHHSPVVAAKVTGCVALLGFVLGFLPIITGDYREGYALCYPVQILGDKFRICIGVVFLMVALVITAIYVQISMLSHRTRLYLRSCSIMAVGSKPFRFSDDNVENSITVRGLSKDQMRRWSKTAKLPFHLANKVSSRLVNVVRAEIKSVKMFVVVVGLLVTCWTPYIVMLNIRMDWNDSVETLEHIVMLIAHLYSGLNAIIYPLFNREFRRMYRKKMCFWNPWWRLTGDANDYPSYFGESRNSRNPSPWISPTGSHGSDFDVTAHVTSGHSDTDPARKKTRRPSSDRRSSQTPFSSHSFMDLFHLPGLLEDSCHTEQPGQTRLFESSETDLSERERSRRMSLSIDVQRVGTTGTTGTTVDLDRPATSPPVGGFMSMARRLSLGLANKRASLSMGGGIPKAFDINKKRISFNLGSTIRKRLDSITSPGQSRDRVKAHEVAAADGYGGPRESGSANTSTASVFAENSERPSRSRTPTDPNQRRLFSTDLDVVAASAAGAASAGDTPSPRRVSHVFSGLFKSWAISSRRRSSQRGVASFRVQEVSEPIED